MIKSSLTSWFDDTGRAAFDGERKTVTALFADIKGSMELMEDLDPEEARAIIDPALKLMMGAIAQVERLAREIDDCERRASLVEPGAKS